MGRDLSTAEGRRDAVLDTMGSFALEGMEPTDEVREWARLYIAGEVSIEDSLKTLDQQYGRSSD